MNKIRRADEPLEQTTYCGSQWPHKSHRWYDKEGKEQECPGRDRKPGERIPSDPRRG